MKTNFLTITIIVIITLVIGVAAGYGIFYLVNQNTKDTTVSKIEETQKETSTIKKVEPKETKKDEKEKDEEVKYVATNSIKVNGKTYNFGMTVEQIDDQKMLVKDYLNGKVIRTYEDLLPDCVLTKDMKLSDYEFVDALELNTIKEYKGEKEYILLDSYKFNSLGNDIHFLTIINQNGEIIGTFEPIAGMLYSSVHVKTDEQDNLKHSYKLDEDSLTLYKTLEVDHDSKPSDWMREHGYSAAKYKVTVMDDTLYTYAIQLYKDDEVVFTGK